MGKPYAQPTPNHANSSSFHFISHVKQFQMNNGIYLKLQPPKHTETGKISRDNKIR